jgi:hypothetical protein
MTSYELENLLQLVGWFSWKSEVKYVCGILEKYGTRLWTVFMWLPEVLSETWDFILSDSREKEK